MRIIERTQLLLGTLYYLLFVFLGTEYTRHLSHEHLTDLSLLRVPLLAILLFLAPFGYWQERTRIHQYPYFFGLAAHSAYAWLASSP